MACQCNVAARGLAPAEEALLQVDCRPCGRDAYSSLMIQANGLLPDELRKCCGWPAEASVLTPPEQVEQGILGIQIGRTWFVGASLITYQAQRGR